MANRKKTLRDRVRDELKARGVRMAEVARATGISESTLSRFGRGEVEGTAALLEALLDHLGARVDFPPRPK